MYKSRLKVPTTSHHHTITSPILSPFFSYILSPCPFLHQINHISHLNQPSLCCSPPHSPPSPSLLPSLPSPYNLCQQSTITLPPTLPGTAQPDKLNTMRPSQLAASTAHSPPPTNSLPSSASNSTPSPTAKPANLCLSSMALMVCTTSTTLSLALALSSMSSHP